VTGEETAAGLVARHERVDVRFRARAAATPDAVALVDRGRLVTCAELDAAGDEVARLLAAGGVPPGGLVGLRLPRGWRVVAAILGIWRHGCGYVPIDPAYPRARQELVVADAGLRHVLDEGDRPGELALSAAAGGAGAGPEVPADVAYVIYTSGSTGRPKGVVVRHASVLALLDATDRVFDLGPGDAWTQFHSHNFDFSVWEVWGALLSGGRCVVVPPEAASDAGALAELLAGGEVTVLNQVPSVFAHLVRALEERRLELPRLRLVIFGGEAINVPAILRWAELGVAPAARLWNMYGITEITVHGTARLLDPQALRRPAAGSPIGRPLPHLRMTLLERGRPVPRGTPGEIHVSGEGVAWGYLGQPELTAQRFLRLEEGGDGPVWYRTGDYAVERDDGELEYLGRRDEQVKLRGFRVELGEIESVLRAQPGVRDCAVVLAEGRTGSPLLAACYVPTGAAGADGGSLREALMAVLPRHLVPSRFLTVPRLPQTLSGKLDRAALAGLAVHEEG
jgi:D-alanine--poly(phosphoribitol) ligase subunit 1